MTEDAGGRSDLHPGRLLRGLASGGLVRSVVLFDMVDSTNRAAMRAARAGSAGGLLCVAEHQTAGRGRAGRRWSSSPGKGLLFSLLLDPTREAESLTQLLAVASVRALDPLCEGVRVKWPNDIYIGSEKAAGILAETREARVVLGMGLNVNEERADFPPVLAERATSMRIVSGRSHSRGAVLIALIQELAECYELWRGSGLEPFVVELERRMLFLGERVELRSGNERFAGIMRGITGEGLLRLDIDGEEHVFPSGDLSLRRRPG